MASNSYLIECTERSVLLQKIKELIASSGFEKEQITYYDLEENTLLQVLEDLDTYSFLTPRKVVVIPQSLFLMASSEKFNEEETNHLLKYLTNPNKDVLLIMGVSKCDERKKLVKELKKLVEVIKIEMDPTSYVREALKDYKINNDALRLLVEYCDERIDYLENECQKLRMYALDTKEIKKEDIEELVIKSITKTDQLVFDFVKYMALKDKKKMFELYDVLKEYQLEVHSIIGLIESQLRLIYQVLLGKEKQMTKDALAKQLKEHPYRIQKTYEFLPFYEEKDLQKLIHELHNLDYKIKSGQVDATLGFEIFLIGI